MNSDTLDTHGPSKPRPNHRSGSNVQVLRAFWALLPILHVPCLVFSPMERKCHSSFLLLDPGQRHRDRAYNEKPAELLSRVPSTTAMRAFPLCLQVEVIYDQGLSPRNIFPTVRKTRKIVTCPYIGCSNTQLIFIHARLVDLQRS